MVAQSGNCELTELVTVALGLGTNVGDRFFNIRETLQLLCRQGVLETDYHLSSILETKALLPEGAPESWNTPYLNAAVKGRTRLSPLDLLSKVKAVEVLLGRNPAERWAPRVIDIDILLYNESDVDSDLLKVPHREISSRPFVAVPLAQVWPDYVIDAHGVRLTIDELASTMLDDESLLKSYLLDGTEVARLRDVNFCDSIPGYAELT